MPFDKGMGDDETEDEKDGDLLAASGSRRRFKEFECPDCAANNPVDDGFGNGDEIICNYCGTEFRVVVDDDARLKLKPN
jgi:hypothetical protein